ncbi:VOC family protein [Gordonia sp. (in: high G+C Gram-positive bacteria)]|uniref:VOC family protein n=1 Tax=Gordonia sp. (in: high G+C Gram-positive bacteria) TaxID=84139 RepID=UPI0039E61A05
MTSATGVSAAVVVSTPSATAAIEAYEGLLGPGRRSGDDHEWRVGSTLLVVRGGDGPPRLLVPATDLVDTAAADPFDTATVLLGRRGLAVEPGPGIADARIAVAGEAPVGVVDAAAVGTAEMPATADIGSLDHVVMTSRSRDAALALFGATLRFDFRLEQQISVPAMGGVHQLFLRGGGTIVEVLVGDAPDDRIALWGLAWASSDVDATHARLTSDGVALSPIRDGHKRGTRVFTVRDDRLAVPTIIIGG